MSYDRNGLSPRIMLRPDAIRSLGERIGNVQDVHTAGKVSWHLYGGLYKVLYRMGEFETTDKLGWGAKRAAAMLLQAQVVAAVEPTPHDIVPKAFTDLMIPLTERLDNEQAPLIDIQQLNDRMLEGYTVIADSDSAMKFIVSLGVEAAMHESLKAAGRDTRNELSH